MRGPIQHISRRRFRLIFKRFQVHVRRWVLCIFVSQFHGHARNRLQCHTAAQKLKWHLWTLVWEGKVYWRFRTPRPPSKVASTQTTNIRIRTGIHLIMSHLTHQNPAIVLICFFFRGQRSGDQDDHQMPQPTHASCFENSYVNTTQQFADVLINGSFSQEPWAHLTVNNLAQWHIKHFLAAFFWFLRVPLETCRNVQETWTMNKYRRNLSRQYELFAYQKRDPGPKTKKENGRH